MSSVLWTIGHSTRPIDEFLSCLNAHGIHLLVNVRTVPGSRYNPQFNGDTLAQSLASVDIRYRHSDSLGGLRKPKKDSINTGWRNASFRGYADYMQTDELMAESRRPHTAIMCAEAVPWRCHRSLIADALVTRGWEVRHIMSETKADRHQPTPFAATQRMASSHIRNRTTARIYSDSSITSLAAPVLQPNTATRS